VIPTDVITPGLYPFSVTGVGGGREHTAPLALIVIPDPVDWANVGPGQSGQLELGGAQAVTMTLDIPAGSFTETTMVTLQLLAQFERPSDLPPAGQVFVRVFRITAGAPLADGQSVILTIHYQDGEVALLEEHLLRLFYWSEQSHSWQSDGVHILLIDPEANVIVAQLDHFTDFALTGYIGAEKIYLPMVVR